jgi:hypothetical protein
MTYKDQVKRYLFAKFTFIALADLLLYYDWIREVLSRIGAYGLTASVPYVQTDMVLYESEGMDHSALLWIAELIGVSNLT